MATLTKPVHRRVTTAILPLLAATTWAPAEEVPADQAPLSPDALKAFVEAHAHTLPATTPASPVISAPSPVLHDERPPAIDLPPAHREVPDDFGGFDDLRLEWTTGTTSYDVDSGDRRITTDGRFAPNGRVSLAWLGSPGLASDGGLLLGCTCADQWSRDSGAATGITLRQYAVDVDVGYGLPCGRNVELELLASLGACAAHGNVTGAGIVRGYGVEWGLRGSLAVTCDCGVQLGLTAGYRGDDTGVHAADGTRFTVHGAGVSVGGFTGMRF